MNPDGPASSPSAPPAPRSALQAWTSFFFHPADPTPLGLVRIATGLLLFWSLGVTGLDLRAYLGSEGWADPAAVRTQWERMAPWAWSFWLHVPDGLLWPVWTVCMVVLVAFTLGLFSRVTAPLAWIIAVGTARRIPVVLFGFDPIVATWSLYLAVTFASGQAVSLDRYLARRRQGRWTAPEPTVSANLGLRLIQIHLCLIYAIAGLSKLQAPTWWDGTAIGKLLGNNEFRPFDLSWLAAYPATEWVVNLATHATIVVELGYPILIWSRGWRPWVLGAALGMHLGIALTMGLTEFSLAMLAGNLAFVPVGWLRGRGHDRDSGVEWDEGAPTATSSASAKVRVGSRRASR